MISKVISDDTLSNQDYYDSTEEDEEEQQIPTNPTMILDGYDRVHAKVRAFLNNFILLGT